MQQEGVCQNPCNSPGERDANPDFSVVYTHGHEHRVVAVDTYDGTQHLFLFISLFSVGEIKR